MEGRCRTQSNDNTTIESSSIISYQDMIEIIRDLKDQVKVELYLLIKFKYEHLNNEIDCAFACKILIKQKESKEESKELSMKLEETLGKQRLQDELMKRVRTILYKYRYKKNTHTHTHTQTHKHINT